MKGLSKIEQIAYFYKVKVGRKNNCIFFKDLHSRSKKSNRTIEADIHKMCRVMHDDSKLVVPPSKWRH